MRARIEDYTTKLQTDVLMQLKNMAQKAHSLSHSISPNYRRKVIYN